MTFVNMLKNKQIVLIFSDTDKDNHKQFQILLIFGIH